MYKRILSALTGFAMAFTMLGAVPSAAETNVSADVNAENINGNEVSIEGTNALGDMLVQKINDAEESDDMGFTIQNVAVDGKNVTVEYSFIKSCTMVVGIFDDEGTVMLGKGVADIVTGSSSETVTIDIDTMPEHFLVKVFMVDSISYRPLGEAYTCELYTKKFQDFMALTTDDFDSESVLNLDEDKTNNFIVLKDGITRLDETDGEIVSSDDSDEQSPVTHTISGASDRVKALKAGDIFAAGDIENIVIAKVGSITVEGDTAVITEGDIKGDEVFKVIKIDVDSSDATVTIDDSYADDGITFLGADVELPDIPDEYNGTGKLYDFSDIPETETQELNGLYKDYSASHDFTFKFIESEPDISKNDGWNVHSRFTGYFKFNVGLDFKIYKDEMDLIDYVRLSVPLDLDLAFTMDFEGYYQYTISRITLATLFGITAEIDPKLYFSGKASVTVKGYIDFSPTVEYHIYTNEFTDQTRLPEAGFDLSAVLDASIGMIISPKATLFSDNIAYVLADLGAGLHFVITKTYNTSVNAKHQCGDCVSGKLYFERTATIEMDIVGLDKITDVLFKMERYLWSFYWSKTYGDHGLGGCKHYECKCTLTFYNKEVGPPLANAIIDVVDQNSGETIYRNYNLDGKGQATLWLPKGNYVITAKLNNAVFKPYYFEFLDYYHGTIQMKYDRSKTRKDPSSSKPDDSSSSKPDSSSSKPDDTSSKPDSDSSAPENLKLTKTKKTLDYKKGNGMKLLEGGTPAGSMGFIDDNDTLFIWGILPENKESDMIYYSDYNYYSIPNIKKAQVQNLELMFLTNDNNLYIWGSNHSERYYYEKPTLIATNVKDFCLNYSYTHIDNYAYIKTNGDLYVSGEFGSGDNSKTYDDHLMMKNVRSVSLGYGSTGACITENDELYMWGVNEAYKIIPHGDETYFDITKIADDVKDVEIQINCTYYITNNGDLHTRGVYSENYLDDAWDFSDQVRMKGIKEVSSASSFSANSLILAENGDLYKIGENNHSYNYSDKYPEMKSSRTNENKDLIITLKNGEEITIPAEERSDYFYKPTKIASNVKTMTNLYNNGMYIDNNNEIYIWGRNLGGGSRDPKYSGIYDRKGLLWDNIQPTPVKLDDIYAQLPTIESETQSENADTSAVAEDDFTGLMPDCIYNVYGFNEDYMDLSNEGLAYIDQFVTDSDGNLPFDKASVSGSEALFWKAVPMTRLSIANAKIEVKDLSYTGEEQFIEPTVTLDGKTLVLNYDYFIAQGDSATDAGEYTGIICGMGEYKGEAEFTYNVTGGGKLGDVNGDNAINVTDISLVAAHVKGRKALSANKFALADINKDGSVNVTDISRIAAHVKGVKSIK